MGIAHIKSKKKMIIIIIYKENFSRKAREHEGGSTPFPENKIRKVGKKYIFKTINLQ